MTHRTSSPLGKEAFFRDLLVPTGQVLEVLLALLQSHMRRDEHTMLAHDAFEPLNLASCYAIRPGNTELDGLADAVEAYAQGMLRIIKSLGQARAPYLAATLGVRFSGSSAKMHAAVRGIAAQFRKELNDLTAPVLAAIGYNSSIRSQWLAEQTAQPTVLTPRGTTNKWRTLVRNTSWQRAVEMLDISAAVANDKLTRNSFTNFAGVEAAALLWREAFAATGTPVSVPAAPGRLPAGVVVRSTSGGELQVEADFDPKQFLDKQQLKAMKAPGRVVTPALSTAMSVRQFRQTCDVLSLAETVQAASTWLQAQRDSKDDVLRVYADWVEEMRVKAVRDKLAQHFNEDERKLLASLFAAEAAKAAA